MSVLTLHTYIKSDLTTCFDLSRSIDLHTISTANTKEKAIAGKTSGLIELNEYVTWEAIHFGVKQKLTSKITQYNRPNHFRDEQQKGIFKYMIHDHFFELQGDEVKMTDVFKFKAPLGFLGTIAEKLFLSNYLYHFLSERNKIIKEFAETDKWNLVLK